jgi:hypothetical protein
MCKTNLLFKYSLFQNKIFKTLCYVYNFLNFVSMYNIYFKIVIFLQLMCISIKIKIKMLICSFYNRNYIIEQIKIKKNNRKININILYSNICSFIYPFTFILF